MLYYMRTLKISASCRDGIIKKGVKNDILYIKNYHMLIIFILFSLVFKLVKQNGNTII